MISLDHVKVGIHYLALLTDNGRLLLHNISDPIGTQLSALGQQTNFLKCGRRKCGGILDI